MSVKKTLGTVSTGDKSEQQIGEEEGQQKQGRGAGIEQGLQSLVIADALGLGWPAKSTHLRLHSTPAQSSETLAKLSGAIRTVLECIGEDPDREGLERTPDRYAKALMWMTKGYEERLSGACLPCFPPSLLLLQAIFSQPGY